MQIPAGFGNAVVLQTMLSKHPVLHYSHIANSRTVALLAHLPRESSMPHICVVLTPDNTETEDAMAVGTGFGQLFRGIGQVGGVAISSALFQSILNVELHKRIHRPDAEEVSCRYPAPSYPSPVRVFLVARF